MLAHDKDGREVTQGLQVAVIALLTKMAYVDGAHDVREYQETIRLAVREFALIDAQAGELRAIAEFLLRDRKQLEEFIDQINEHFDLTQREHIAKLVWKIALADGRIDKIEIKFNEYVRSRLELPSSVEDD